MFMVPYYDWPQLVPLRMLFHPKLPYMKLFWKKLPEIEIELHPFPTADYLHAYMINDNILMNHFLVILLFLYVIKFRILIMHIIIIYSLSMIKHARYTIAYHDGFVWIGNFFRVIIRYSLQVQVFILSHSTVLILRIPYNLSHHFVFLLSRNIRNVQMLIIINKPWIKWFQLKIKV